MCSGGHADMAFGTMVVAAGQHGNFSINLYLLQFQTSVETEEQTKMNGR